MAHRLSIFACTVAFLAMAFSTGAGEVIDRIVATVNGHVILQSDWEDSLRYEAFSSGRPLDRLTVNDRKAALDRLIDQELLREQLRSSDAAHASAQEVAASCGRDSQAVSRAPKLSWGGGHYSTATG